MKTSERIPFIRAGHALRSLRDSGYSFPAALGETIDNSLEADANVIGIIMEEARDRSGKRHISRIITVDDGRGMDPVTLHHYPQLGFSTRYMSTTTIGKYGVGAKLAALNWCRRIDVWSRADKAKPWLHVFLDLDELDEQEEEREKGGIAPPEEDAVPSDIGAYLPEGTGTAVVWTKVDRLEEGRLAPDAKALRNEVEKELARMFRYFLNGGIKLLVNERPLLPHDPLFLMEGTWAEKVLREEQGRKGELEGREKPDLEELHFPASVIGRKTIRLNDSEAKLVLTLYPKEAVQRRMKGRSELAQKLRIPENQGAISFVRLNREINYTNVPRIFPLGVEDRDRYIGIEVSFKPEMDEYFGVRNVKRGVEPHDALRREIRDALNVYIREARANLEEIWGKAARKSRQHEGEHAEIEKAVKEVNQILPKSRAEGPESDAERDRIYEDLAKDVGKDKEQEKRDYLERIRTLPFVIESVNFPGTNFIDVTHLDGQVIIRVNTRHRFYRELWEPVQEVANQSPGLISGDDAVRISRKMIEALTLLLIAYAKAESMDENPRLRYGDLRSYWGQFLETLMGKVKDVV